MSAYDPFALWLMERERRQLDLELVRRIRERGAEQTRRTRAPHAGAEPVARPAARGRRGIRPLLPGDA